MTVRILRLPFPLLLHLHRVLVNHLGQMSCLHAKVLIFFTLCFFNSLQFLEWFITKYALNFLFTFAMHAWLVWLFIAVVLDMRTHAGAHLKKCGCLGTGIRHLRHLILWICVKKNAWLYNGIGFRCLRRLKILEHSFLFLFFRSHRQYFLFLWLAPKI